MKIGINDEKAMYLFWANLLLVNFALACLLVYRSIGQWSADRARATRVDLLEQLNTQLRRELEARQHS